MNKKIRLILSPLLIILAILIIYYGNIVQFLTYAFVVSLHELAHFLISKKLGYKLNNLYIMPYGICLNYKDSAIEGSDEILIALAGPFINILLCFISVALWWLFPETYYYLDYFCFCNLVLGVFNLVPCFPLDGGRVLVSLLSKKIDREKAYNISIAFNYVISAILVVLFVSSFFSEVNYTYITLAIFLFSGCINPNKYSNYNYLSLGVNRSKVIKNGTNVKLLAFSSSVPLYKIVSKFSRYKFNIVYVVFASGLVKVLSESNINSLAIKYSPAMTLDEITALKN